MPSTTITDTTTIVVSTVNCLGVGDWLDAAELARACGAEPGFVDELIEEGLLQATPGAGFGGDDLARVRRIQRLQADFDASLPAVALMLDLIDEVDRLQARLRRLDPRA